MTTSAKLHMELGKHLLQERHKNSASWNMREIQSRVNDPRVYTAVGPMCRWSMKARGLDGQEGFVNSRSHP